MNIDFTQLLKQARSFDPRLVVRQESNVRRFEYKGKSFTNLAGDTSDSPADKFRDILTPEELADRLKVPVSWIFEKRRPRCKNPIPAIPMGKVVRFDWNTVVNWLEEQAAKDVASIEQKRNSLHARKRSVGPRLVKTKTMKTKEAA